LKISDIPLMGNLALYPTVEILDRLHPPVGQEWHYPIPIEFSLEDLKLAADGNLVTRVVYLEQPRDTLVGPATPDDPQPYFNVGSREDPLKVADYLGRAVAIVHIGSRQPDPTGDDEFFVGESPVPAPAIGALQLGARPQTHARAAQVSYDAPAAARPVARSYPRTTIPSSRRRSKSKPSKVPAFNLMQSNLLESLKTQ
jgi:hypothetical protein